MIQKPDFKDIPLFDVAYFRNTTGHSCNGVLSRRLNSVVSSDLL